MLVQVTTFEETNFKAFACSVLDVKDDVNVNCIQRHSGVSFEIV